MEVTNAARQYIQQRPTTSLFIGLLLVSSCIPVMIFAAVVIGFFLVMLTGLLIVQGTVIGIGLTALLVILPGPLCFATFCTLLAYVAQCAFAKVKPVCENRLVNVLNRMQTMSGSLAPSQARLFNEGIIAFVTRASQGDADSISTDDGDGDASPK